MPVQSWQSKPKFVKVFTESEITKMLSDDDAATPSWRPNAAVSITEYRKCTTCGYVHNCPGGVFLEQTRRGSRRLTSPKHLPPFISLRELPHRTEPIATTIDGCHRCFQPDYDGCTYFVQLQLFPLPPRSFEKLDLLPEDSGLDTSDKPGGSGGRRRNAKKAIVPFSLSDF